MKVKRISIFLPRNNYFYRRLLAQIIQAFQTIGISANGKCDLLGEAQLQNWVSEYRPDVIFEMNRVGSELPVDNLSVKHVSWLVDFGGRDQTQIHGSDIIYYFDPGAAKNTQANCYTDWLPPGTCTDHYFSNGEGFETDFIFVGHIPAPWSEQELDTLIGFNRSKKLYFSELLYDYIKCLDQPFDCAPTHKILKDRIHHLVEMQIGKTMLTQKVEYDLLERLTRVRSRKALVGAAASVDLASLAVYGSETWSQWPEYRKYFRRFLSNTESLRKMYSNSRYCLHDGVELHFRSMDCMASGGVILYRDDENFKYPSIDNAKIGLFTYFDEGEHYLRFDTLEEIEEIYQRYKDDDTELQRIGANAAAMIRKNHTWGHRAKQIVEDIQKYI